jgi:hypothetical protein
VGIREINAVCGSGWDSRAAQQNKSAYGSYNDIIGFHEILHSRAPLLNGGGPQLYGIIF